MSAPTEIDELTLARAKRGDHAAALVLVRMYEKRVFALLSRMLRGRTSASRVEELAQETFLRVFRELHGFEANGQARLSTWLLTIAARLSIDELRRRTNEVRALGQSATDVTSLSSLRSDAETERRALREALACALDSLPADQRAVVILRDYHELAYEEIAEVLACDLGTVKSRLFRARARLRELLAEVHDG